jgi:MarR family transcriptional regulator, 2-MHQ and catechol-resistance regulon repressor
MQTAAHIRLILARAANAVERVDRASIARTGLNPSDFGILEALLHKGPMPINTIGSKVLLTSGSMTTAANRLVAKGLTVRVKDPADARRCNLHLTDSGRTLIESAYADHVQNLESIVRDLDARERHELVRLLKKIGCAADAIDSG